GPRTGPPYHAADGARRSGLRRPPRQVPARTLGLPRGRRGLGTDGAGALPGLLRGVYAAQRARRAADAAAGRAPARLPAPPVPRGPPVRGLRGRRAGHRDRGEGGRAALPAVLVRLPARGEQRPLPRG